MKDVARVGIVFIMTLWAALLVLMVLSAVCEGADSCSIPGPKGALNPSCVVDDDNWQVVNAQRTDDAAVFFIENRAPVNGQTHGIAVYRFDDPDYPALFCYVENGELKGVRLAHNPYLRYVWDEAIQDPEVHSKLCTLFRTYFPNPPKINSRKLAV